MRLTPFALAAALAAAAPALADDLTIVSKSTHNNDAPTTLTSYLGSDHARMAQPNGHEIIVDAKAGEFTMVDNNKKEYSTMTKADMDAWAVKMQEKSKEMDAQMAKSQEAMKKNEEAMKNLPPAIREKMQAAMGNMGAAMAASIDVKKSPAPARKIAGYSCDTWIISIGEMSQTEECRTTELTLPAGSYEAFRQFADSFKAMGGGQMAKSMTAVQEKMKELKGYPIATTTTVKLLGKSNTDTTEVTEIKKGPIPASAWKVPDGYKKVTSPMSKMS
jgi:hypothetical protein